MYKLTKNQFNFLVSLVTNRAEIDIPREMRNQVYELFYRVGYERTYSEYDRNILNSIRREFLQLKLRTVDMDDLPF
jgi:replication-associated recombination protein RarA